MLTRYRDALTASTTLTTGEHDARLLLFPPSFNAAMRELAHCLEEMRQPVLRRLRWHTLAWYVDVDWIQKPILVRKASRQGWVTQTSGYRLEPRRTPDASETLAAEGVGWLTSTYRWNEVHLRDITAAAGETLELEPVAA
jgi:hypothetical protein